MKQKISAMVIEMAEGFIDQAESHEEKENLLRFTCTAWNIACFEFPKREQQLEKYIETFKTSNNAPEEACDYLREDMKKLIEKKNRLFPNEIKRIVGSQVTVVNGQEHIEISSVPFA
jgi:hypothetical protein